MSAVTSTALDFATSEGRDVVQPTHYIAVPTVQDRCHAPTEPFGWSLPPQAPSHPCCTLHPTSANTFTMLSACMSSALTKIQRKTYAAGLNPNRGPLDGQGSPVCLAEATLPQRTDSEILVSALSVHTHSEVASQLLGLKGNLHRQAIMTGAAGWSGQPVSILCIDTQHMQCVKGWQITCHLK